MMLTLLILVLLIVVAVVPASVLEACARLRAEARDERSDALS